MHKKSFFVVKNVCFDVNYPSLREMECIFSIFGPCAKYTWQE